MTPIVVGTSIHINFPDDPSLPCRHAVITGFDETFNLMYISVHLPRGDQFKAVIPDAFSSESWHLPTSCPRETEMYK